MDEGAVLRHPAGYLLDVTEVISGKMPTPEWMKTFDGRQERIDLK